MAFELINEDDIHMRQKITPERDLFFVVVLLALIILDSVAMYFIVQDKLEMVLLFHSLVMVASWGMAKIKELNDKDARFAWVCTIAVPVMGPFAPLGTLFALFWFQLSREKSLTYRQWRDSIFPPEEKTLAQIVYDRISFGRDQAGEAYSVTYLMDVLKFGHDEKKREAIYKILRHYDPSFAPLLKMALEDDHNAIRVQAATAMTKLKNNYFNECVRLERLMEEWPEKTILLYEIAKQYDAFAFSGLLDDKQMAENQDTALYYYDLFLESKEDNEALLIEAKQRMARLLLRMNRVEEACNIFAKLKDEGHATPDSNIWHSECLFRLHRYAELRALAFETVERVVDSDPLKVPNNIRGVMLLWGVYGQEASA